MNEVTASIPREVLESPFPPDMIKTRPGAYGGSLSYLEGSTVIARLNQAFDGSWSFEVTNHQILEDEVLVLGKFRSDAVVKMAFGSSKITRNEKTGAQVALGDDLKAAATDALKKAATLLGVGLYLYATPASEDSAVQRAAFADDLRDPRPDPRKGTAGSPGSHGTGNGESGRVTNRQISAIFGIARERRMSNTEVRELAKKLFNRNVDYLTKHEASSLIEHLLAH